ncbi:phosphomannomutase/phosphoglucomutase [Selenomonas sp.]|uniref:phosphomannomutase/phosphoglucomutase n=1 Tax=Selenomonas sp. TaxID=2053611 RepID=UPI0025E16EC5|nr:phosphomannomutase/phosphoglucomutase [Selenomonas sp.]MBQ1866761.1 phosphomannomutase/phosphoglucomutase [Selenomonas sp.]
MIIPEKNLMKLANGSDVRGVAMEGVADEPVNLTTDAANVITSGFVEFLAERTGKAKKDLRIAVGRDSRLTGHDLKREVLKALTAHGVVTVDCSMASTPAMFMSTVFPETQMDGSIMITASHLPYNRNGMKFFTKDGGVEHEDIITILQNASRYPVMEGERSKAQRYNLMERYSHHLRKKIREALGGANEPLKGMHIVVDAGNGAGGFFATQVLGRLGADTTGSAFLEPDGHFPNHIPNPENKQAMAAIRQAVLDNRADLGLIFDTDVDRMSAVLKNGKEISRNELIGMMAAILAPDYPGSTIITDSVTSDELTEFLEKDLGLKHLRYMRGYKNVIDECIRQNNAGVVSPLAIETSGHGALSENYYLDDGAYLAVKLLVAAAKAKAAGRKLSDLVKNLGAPQESQEFRIKIKGEEDFRAYGNGVLKTVEERAIAKGIKIAKPSYEGVRLVFPNGWALLRMSLHDPNMPLNVESSQEGGVKEIAVQVEELLEGFNSLDLSVFAK